ncbi:BMC domain-containing protein [Companilactobacillus paralimentarius]|uniref:BMC domain-containing protein n=1 Tax=Companilactobacillus paralimentarius TaxID=83526 RepID=UPI0028532D6F|nr:BMC domain-containing protein [Companilactobacillus paralimentarius]MDR4932619.1 BMC domain-containing protein [Companilactobacillus paralimentarius]
MQALGLIETNGLIAAIESSDVMLKTAEVDLVSKEFVGGGLVTVSVVGDVGAVKTAVDAGASAVEQLGDNFLVSKHVIARPDSEIEPLLDDPKAKKIPEEIVEEDSVESKEETPKEKPIGFKPEELEPKRIAELRKIVKTKTDLNISDADLQKMSKKQIITEILNSDKEG